MLFWFIFQLHIQRTSAHNSPIGSLIPFMLFLFDGAKPNLKANVAYGADGALLCHRAKLF